MLSISIITPNGELYKETVQSVVVASDVAGDYGILVNHLPIVSTIKQGYIKLENEQMVYYVVVLDAIVEHHNNQITVIASDAFIGQSKEEAFQNLNDLRKERIEENKKRNVELALAEQELKRQIKQTGAGSL